MSRVIFEKRFDAYRRDRAEWIRQRPEHRRNLEEAMKRLEERRGTIVRQRPNDPDAEAGDPRPDSATMRRLLASDLPQRAFTESDDDFYGGRDLVWSLEVGPQDIRATARELPRLKGKSWWLTKQVQTFAVAEMRDLEFEPAVPILAIELRAAEGSGPAHCPAQYGTRALPFVLAGLQSADRSERRLAVSILADREEPPFDRRPTDSRLAAPLLNLSSDDDPRMRQKACEALAANWNPNFAPRVTALLGDSDEDVRSAAFECLKLHREDLATQISAYKKMVEEDNPAASKAIVLLPASEDAGLTREQLVRLFSSTNLPVVATAFGQLRYRNLDLSEIAPLLTNPLPHARLMGLGALRRIGDKAAVERIVSSLRDPNEGIRWMVRSNLRRLTRQKLGADPAAWEKWWADNRETFTPPPAGAQRSERN